MRAVTEHLNKNTPKPKSGARYVVRRMSGGNYGPYPGDPGLIIPKLLNLGKDEQLLRLGYIEEYKQKDQFECGRCGNKFSTMQWRDSHFRKRHGERFGPIIRNIEDLNEAQKQLLKDSAADYQTMPGDFMIPDPEDSRLLAEEKHLDAVAPLYLDKTKASRK